MPTGERRLSGALLLAALLLTGGCQEAGLDISLSSNAAQVALGGTADLSAIVVDQDGDPVGGADVVFSSTGGLLTSNGATRKTGDDGVATDSLAVDLDETATEIVVTATATDGDVSGSSSLTLPVDRRGGGRP